MTDADFRRQQELAHDLAAAENLAEHRAERMRELTRQLWEARERIRVLEESRRWELSYGCDVI